MCDLEISSSAAQTKSERSLCSDCEKARMAVRVKAQSIEPQNRRLPENSNAESLEIDVTSIADTSATMEYPLIKEAAEKGYHTVFRLQELFVSRQSSHYRM